MTLMNWPEMASTGEAILFGCVAVFMVACALGVLFFKKAVYCAICMVGVMLGLAILYLMHGAAFLGTVQVVVYTGAIMVLFLFVIMMIGLSASDNYARQSRGRIVTSVLMALGLGAILIGAIARSRTAGSSASLSDDPYSNAPITDLAATLFSRYWFSMELAGILLITAAIGAHSLRSARSGTHAAHDSRSEDARLQGLGTSNWTAPGPRCVRPLQRGRCSRTFG